MSWDQCVDCGQFYPEDELVDEVCRDCRALNIDYGADPDGDGDEELAVCTECDWEGYISGETCPACGGFLVEE